MSDLTDRQKDLLRVIIELHVKTGEPVGSELVEKESNLGVSPATIRNEMARLTDLGYLKQPHTSAGRAPTPLAYRVYITELMKERSLPVSVEVSIKEAVWERRHEYEQVLKSAVKALAAKSGLLGLAVEDGDGEIYYAGTSNILDWAEFADIDVTRFVLSLFDQYPMLHQILGRALGSEPMHVLFGEELGYEQLEPTSFVFCRYVAPEGAKSGVVGVIGPARMDFQTVLPYVRYTGEVITLALNSWKV